MSKQERNESDVARLRAQIDREIHAAWQGLYGVSQGYTKHEFITARYDRTGVLRNELGQLVGEDAAMQVVLNAMNIEGETRQADETDRGH